MPVTYILNVTEEDIDYSVRTGDAKDICSTCPLARAFQRLFNNPDMEVAIAFADCKILGSSIPLTTPMQTFVSKFDTDEEVSPSKFEFTLDEPYKFDLRN